MKLLKKIKKGFTLVELVVVIAVIAILSAVGAITYVNVTNNARKSNDISALATLNRGLVATEIYKGQKPETMHEALMNLDNIAGISNPEKFLKAQYTEFEFAYDLQENRFVLLEGDKISEHAAEIEYPETTVGQKNRFWRMLSNSNGIDNVGEDTYCSYFIANANIAKEITINSGVDFGYNPYGGKINYVHNGTEKTSTIRTNGGELFVDSKTDTVYHYDFADVVNVRRIKNESYHEFGDVSFLEVSSGHIVFEKTSDVDFLYFQSNEVNKFEDKETGVGITLDVTEATNIPAFARSNVEINKENGTKVCEIETSDSNEAVWLWLLGIEEQMKLTDDLTATSVSASTAGIGQRDDETATLAKEIANNVVRAESGKPVKADGVTEVEINTNGTFVDTTITSLDDLKEPEGGFIKEKEDIQSEAIVYGGGNGTELAPYRIKSRKDFEFIYSHYDSYYYYIVDTESGLWSQNPTTVSPNNTVGGTISKDGKAHMDASNWALKLTDSNTFTTRNNLFGQLAGNGLVIDNLDTWLFTNVGASLTDTRANVISDLTLNMHFTLDGVSGAAALFRNLGTKNLTLSNITVHGEIYGNCNTGSFYGYGTCNYAEPGCNYTANFINCYSDATLYDIGSGNVGGFVGHVYPGTNHTATFNITNSQFSGTTYCKGSNSSCNFCASGAYSANITGTNNTTLPMERKKVMQDATITKDAGYKVTIPTGATYALVNIAAQVTTYNADGTAQPNQSGITMVLSAQEFTNITGTTLTILDEITSIVETAKTAERQTAELNEGVLTLKLNGNQAGNLSVKVTFFDQKGGILLASGTKQIAVKAGADFNKLNAWTIK